MCCVTFMIETVNANTWKSTNWIPWSCCSNANYTTTSTATSRSNLNTSTTSKSHWDSSVSPSKTATWPITWVRWFCSPTSLYRSIKKNMRKKSKFRDRYSGSTRIVPSSLFSRAVWVGAKVCLLQQIRKIVTDKFSQSNTNCNYLFYHKLN